MEIKRGYINPHSLSFLIQEFARRTREFKSLELDFNPIADEDFTSRLAGFARIQAATITIARPNVDWTDLPPVFGPVIS